MAANIARLARAAGCMALAIGMSHTASAQSLKVGLSSEPTAIDPHYHELTPNYTLSNHIFETLTRNDANARIQPRLAVSWSNRDDRTWVFKLREDVKFTNGAPFTADDVIYSLCRILNNETSVSGSFTEPVKNMEKVTKEGDHTLVITTKNPDPLLINDLAQTFIISKAAAKVENVVFDPATTCGVTGPWPTVSQFNDGTLAIGTGPYKLKSYTKGGTIELTRNDAYWGEKPHWAEVRMTAVPNAGPRLAGLVAGDFDLIENPAARDLGRIRGNDKFAHVVTPSNRVIFLQLDQRENSPFVKSDKGNPMRDVRVRQAMSMAIDRKAIVRRIMDNAAEPANQFLPANMFGAMPDAPELAYDPQGAKKLLAEAGYPNGFQLTLHATNDRYINDGQIAQAIAQYLTQVGIKTEVDAMTRSIYFTRRAKQEFSFSMGGWGSSTGEASSFLRQWVATMNKETGLGLSNYGGFSDPEFDKVISEAIKTMDSNLRETRLRQAGKRAMEQMSHIPIHLESSIWAFRKGIDYEGRADQLTLVMDVRPRN
jgi:peptide/nickel transport system substrate-binding protein